jgi:hypothetical protein
MTHKEIRSPHLRAVLANELLVLRSSVWRMRRMGLEMDSDFVYGIRTGLDTFARRLEMIERVGLEVAYKQNYAAEGGGKGAGSEANINE